MTFLYDCLSYLRLCLRNIRRNRRRTLITLLSIVIGTLALILTTGYINVMKIGIESSAIANEFGHLQVAKTGYFEADQTSYEHMMSEEQFTAMENYLYSLPEVDFVNMRLHIAGIAGDISHSTVFLGICGKGETEVFMLPAVISGEPFTGSEYDTIVIGEAMARKLDVQVGDPLLLFFLLRRALRKR